MTTFPTTIIIYIQVCVWTCVMRTQRDEANGVHHGWTVGIPGSDGFGARTPQLGMYKGGYVPGCTVGR